MEILIACRPKDCTPEQLEALKRIGEDHEDMEVVFLYNDDQEINPRLKDRIVAFPGDPRLGITNHDEARKIAESAIDGPDELSFGYWEYPPRGDHDGDSMLPAKHYDQKIPHLQRGGYLGRNRRR